MSERRRQRIESELSSISFWLDFGKLLFFVIGQHLDRAKKKTSHSSAPLQRVHPGLCPSVFLLVLAPISLSLNTRKSVHSFRGKPVHVVPRKTAKEG